MIITRFLSYIYKEEVDANKCPTLSVFLYSAYSNKWIYTFISLSLFILATNVGGICENPKRGG